MSDCRLGGENADFVPSMSNNRPLDPRAVVFMGSTVLVGSLGGRIAT